MVVLAGCLVVAVDRTVGVSPADLAAAWDGDDEARKAGLASVKATRPGEFIGDALALVVIPLAVNLTSSAACALVGRVLAGLRSKRDNAAGPEPEADGVEIVALANGAGELVVVVRMPGLRQ